MSINHLKITYCHGSENYFLLVDGFSQKLNFKETDYRHFCLDAIDQVKDIPIDGLLYLLPSDKADARMRIFNKDGSEAEMCGNGFRCTGKKLYQLTGKTTYKIETLAGILQGRKEIDLYPYIDSFSVNIPVAGYTYQDKYYNNRIIPALDPELQWTSIDVGNPHLIAEVKNFDIDKLIKTGQQVNQNCKIFPKGNNISFYKVLDIKNIAMLTYERGVGLTNACGTAMSATTMVAAHKKQINFNHWTNVITPGGMVKCLPQNQANELITLLGNATFINDYIIEYQHDKRQLKQLQLKLSYNSEQKNYQQFKTDILQQHKIHLNHVID